MWSLYNKETFLEPLKFSNGKTQEDVVKEVVDSIKDGYKTIFIHGVCGTGKSAIALNIAKNLGKTSIVVPGKSLQAQYQRDYQGDKYLTKDNKEKLKISIITGRNNHPCLYLQDSEVKVPIIKKEVNSKLSDIFENKTDYIEKKKKEDESADNPNIPCKIEIKEKNFFKIREYLRRNKDVNLKNILKINDVRRIPLASVCPYWSPVLPEKYDLKNVDFSKKMTYEGLNGVKFNIYKRKPGCKFYEQYESYVDADVIVFNSLKYKLESALNRKPKTEIEIIDEGDEFLDSFSNQRSVNLDRLQNSMIQMAGINESIDLMSSEINNLIVKIKSNTKIVEAINSRKIIPLKETPVYVLLKLFLDSPEFLEEIEEESYLFDFEETARMFEDFFDETFLSFSKKDNNFVINMVTTNLAKRFNEMVDKNKFVILMSGTLHSEKILKEIFGMENFKIIQAETKQPGKINILRTGMEFDCKHENLSNEFGREHFLKAFDECMKKAEKPVLVHVSAFNDLPTESEINNYNLKNLISRDKFIESQSNDKEGKVIDAFKKGEINKLFTTKCARGVDFPGEQCNSIVFTKYPNPNPEEAFWKILRETRKEYYWDFYKDKARRELLQKVYRGLRFKEDKVFVLSPDKRVLDFFEN